MASKPTNDDRVYVSPEKSNPVSSPSQAVTRGIEELWQSHETMEGAGVRLRRAFGNHEVPRFDPFLLLDDFRSEEPADYEAGFPWHPHRGIETVTYMIDGFVEHGDSLGNKGVIGAGDVQWMTAGSGIIHQEMPRGDPTSMGGLQLWVNLPASSKMSQPRYQEFRAKSIPEVPVKQGLVRVVAGSFRGVEGPTKEITVRPQFLDVKLEAGAVFEQPVACGHRAFAYILDGKGKFEDGGDLLPGRTLVAWEDGDKVRIETGNEGVRFLLASGQPIKEPVAWWGPIVMNQQMELRTAVDELKAGTFVKTGAKDVGDARAMHAQGKATPPPSLKR